jgi:stress response protein YsnF
VPIRHEEVSVERVPVEGREASEAEIGEDEITMPVTKEEVITEKRPVVKGEIRIRKDAVQDEDVVEEDVKREEVDVEDATATRGRRGAGKTARTANPEGRAEEDRPGREETGRDEDFFEKAKRKLQGQ